MVREEFEELLIELTVADDDVDGDALGTGGKLEIDFG